MAAAWACRWPASAPPTRAGRCTAMAAAPHIGREFQRRTEMLLTQDQEMIRDAVRAFAQEQLWPNAARWDKEHHFPRAAHQGLAALGAYGICVPEELGGAGSAGSWKKQESSRKTSISALLTMPKPLSV